MTDDNDSFLDYSRELVQVTRFRDLILLAVRLRCQDERVCMNVCEISLSKDVRSLAFFQRWSDAKFKNNVVGVYYDI